MAKDKPADEQGISPKARDGEPNGDNDAAMSQRERDQLAMARARKEAAAEEAARRSDDAAEEAMGGGKRGRPIDDQDPPADDDQATMFPLGAVEGDAKVDWKKLVPAGKSVKLECNLSRAAVPLLNGLYRFGETGEVLVAFEAGMVKNVPDLEEDPAGGERKLKGVTLRQDLRAIHVRSADQMFSLDQVLDILEAHFGVPRTADKVAEVFGLKPPQAAAG